MNKCSHCKTTIANAFSGLKNLLKNGFFHILTGNFLNKAIIMISSIVIVRLVDKEAYADISYADNLYSYISFASGLGMANALLKFCSADQDKELDMAYVNYSVKVGGTFELAISLALCIIVSFVNVPYVGARNFVWGLLLHPFIAYLITVGSVYMRTQLENKKYAYVGLTKSLLVCVFSVVFVCFFGVNGIIPARYLSLIFVIVYVLIYYKKETKGKKATTLSKEQKKKFIEMGLSLGFADFFSSIMPINENFLVNNIIRDPIITSNFKVAGLLPQLLFMVSGAITLFYFPFIARMKDFSAIRKKVVQIAIINATIVVILTCLGMLFTPIIIRILYGDKYLDAVSISYLLWIMRATNCIIRVVPINMLVAIGKTKFNLYMSIISCGLQCIIDYVFINSLGINGVAIGATIIYFLSGIAYWMYFMHCCKLKMTNYIDKETNNDRDTFNE